MENPDAAVTLGYPLPSGDEPVPLYTGPVTVDGKPTTGTVEFRLRPRPEVTWRLDLDEYGRAVTDVGVGDVELVIPHALGSVVQTAQRHAHADGHLQPVEVGSTDATLHRVVAGWLNLPAFRSPGVIQDGTWTFTGRWSADVNGWTVVVDRRGDHKAIYSRVKEGNTEITHVTQISRADGTTFSPAAAQQMLDSLHLGVSFAIGRWVAPILPVGYDEHGTRAWESWGARYCTSGAPGGLSWWFQQRDWELQELLHLVASSYADPSLQFSTRFLLSSATLAAAGGFVEQRIMTAAAALDHLTWTTLTVAGGMSTTTYKGMKAADRLARAAAAASITDRLDPELTPNLCQYATDHLPDRLTAPDVLCAVRNRIVHPAGRGDDLYEQYPNIIVETWLLARHYLVLLILHHLGYQGTYQLQLKPGGWAGDVKPVPWSASAAR